MSNHHCPHANRNCRPGAPCTPCTGRGGVLKDGEGVIVPMMLCDAASVAAQRAIDSARRPAPAVTEQQRRQVRAEAYADHYREKHEARQAAIAADPVAKAYYAQFEPRGRG